MDCFVIVTLHSTLQRSCFSWDTTTIRCGVCNTGILSSAGSSLTTEAVTQRVVTATVYTVNGGGWCTPLVPMLHYRPYSLNSFPTYNHMSPDEQTRLNGGILNVGVWIVVL